MDNILNISNKDVISTLLANVGKLQAADNITPAHAREILADSIHLRCFPSSKDQQYTQITEINSYIQEQIETLAKEAVSDIKIIENNLSDSIKTYSNQISFFDDGEGDNKKNISKLFMDIFNIDLCYSAMFSYDEINPENYYYPNRLMESYDDNIEVFFDIVDEVKVLFNSYDENLGWEKPEVFAALSVSCQLLERYRQVSGDGDIFTEEEVQEIIAAMLEVESKENCESEIAELPVKLGAARVEITDYLFTDEGWVSLYFSNNDNTYKIKVSCYQVALEYDDEKVFSSDFEVSEDDLSIEFVICDCPVLKVIINDNEYTITENLTFYDELSRDDFLYLLKNPGGMFVVKDSNNIIELFKEKNNV